MVFEIIKHTPIWVFILFIGLLYLGYTQTKDRKVKLKKLFILPIAMILLSIFGIISAFGLNKITLTLWVFSAIFSLIIGLKLFSSRNIKYDKFEKKFHISGSWIPMLLILMIFFIKYIVGVVVARELAIINDIEFIITISSLYGLLSGLFLSRSIVIFQSSIYNKTQEEEQV